ARDLGERRRRRLALPDAPGDESGHQQQRRRGGEADAIGAEQRRPPGCVLLGQLVADTLPHFETVLIAALGYLGRGDHRERARDLAIQRGARRAAVEVPLDVRAPTPFAIVVERQVVFGVVLHDSTLRSGASATRSFFTARNTLCFAALVPSPSAAEISSIDRPS